MNDAHTDTNAPHRLNVEDFADYEMRHLVAWHAGQGFQRRLELVVKDGEVRYEVSSFGQTLCETGSFAFAIDTYNSITRQPAAERVSPPNGHGKRR